jgi:hypothetical protein
MTFVLGYMKLPYSNFDSEKTKMTQLYQVSKQKCIIFIQKS